ncbi:MAG: tetratricopeptide repeat protein [Candidatus Binatia bacterium]
MRLLKPILVTVAAACLSFPLASLSHRKPSPATDYEIELARIQKDIAELDGASSPQVDIDRALKLPHRMYHRAQLTGSAADLQATEGAIDRALGEMGPLAGLYLLKVNLDFKLHRLKQAEASIAALSRFAGDARILAIKAGIDFQRGRYEAAKVSYLRAVEKNPSWDNLARLAYWQGKFGDPDLADRLYRQAAEEISAKEMRAYAWVELQRGLLDLNRGRYDEAMDHYRTAGKAYSGYWLVDEHIAELLGATRKVDAAAELYESVVARAPLPELHQRLGDLYVFMGKPERARPWHDRAEAAYLESARRGEVHYYHHLASFYSDARHDGAEAVKWAQKDIELRSNFATQDALAWALYRAGRFAEAQNVSREALSSGVEDAHLSFHAAMIHLAAGKIDEGKRLLKKAAEINPGYKNFHAHR